MRSLEEKLGYIFWNPTLLENALTHSSYANEHREEEVPSNERMEFLGDSVLGLVVSDHLYSTQPNLPEGDLTRIRASLVCESSLVEVAKRLGLGAYLRLGKGEDAGGGRTRASILADAVEAIIAAVYLDSGLGQARKLIQSLILRKELMRNMSTDFKTTLQELVQKKAGRILSYRLVDEKGPNHAKVFSVEVDLNGVVVGKGKGHSKKGAEQAAAKAAIENLKKQ